MANLLPTINPAEGNKVRISQTDRVLARRSESRAGLSSPDLASKLFQWGVCTARSPDRRGWLLLFSGARSERPSAGMADQCVPSWVVRSLVVWFPSVSGLMVSCGLLHAALSAGIPDAELTLSFSKPVNVPQPLLARHAV